MSCETAEYKEKLRVEISDKYPLLSGMLPLSSAQASQHLSWNEGNIVFCVFELLVTKKKYDNLSTVASMLRIVRPDGNCFYRSYASRIIEVRIDDSRSILALS